ncbi:MAG: DUF349 domain-containing protein [Bacteroidetes bacterium]|nr:DUF349 domain-containing protein [Bacteroidota bacterium]
MKQELIKKFEELLLKNAGEVASDVRTLQKEYQKEWTLQFEKTKQQFIDDGGKAKEFEFTKDKEDLYFDTLIEKYQKLKKEDDKRIEAEQEKNLKIRKEIVAKISDLSKLSDNVGAAFKMLQELQTQWKEVGPVSSHRYKELQAEYSKAIEDFHYNLKIYRDLQEHDLKKNYELKTELIKKLNAVIALENIKEAERLIKVYRNEWDEIGPVPNEKWDELKVSYKTTLDEVYSKIKGHYQSIEELKENNLASKKVLIEKANELVNAINEKTRWNETTDAIIALQTEWKTIGRAAEKENDKVWQDFRAICDAFFEKKKEYFAGLNEKFAVNRKIKAELISKAEALQNSTDWQKTGLDLIKLQDQWKKNPSNGDKEEPKLFAKFRKACNTFFDAKKAFYENLDASFEGNLKAKEEILTRLNDFKLSEDAKSNFDTLKAFSTEFNAAGMVPLKDKKRVNDTFYSKLDELYDQLNIDKKEKALIQFKTKLDKFVNAENAYELLKKENDFLRKISDELNGNIRTYENNLGFFKNSKSSNDFVKEIEAKIEIEKQKIAELTAKRKLVSDELTKLRENIKG